jgi:hypothetical protein
VEFSGSCLVLLPSFHDPQFTVQIPTHSQAGIPPAREWFNGNHQAASPVRLSAGSPSVGFG